MYQKIVIITYLVDGVTQIFWGWKRFACLLLSCWNLTQIIAILYFILGCLELQCVEHIYASVYMSTNWTGRAFALNTCLQCHGEVIASCLGVFGFARSESAVGSELMTCELYAWHGHWF